MAFRGIVHQVDQLASDEVEVVELEDAWGLKYQHLDDPGDTHELIVLFVVVYQLEQHLGEEEPILVGFGLPNQTTLVAKTAFGTDFDEELDDMSESGIVVGLGVELLQQVDNHSVSAGVEADSCIILLVHFLRTLLHLAVGSWRGDGPFAFEELLHVFHAFTHLHFGDRSHFGNFFSLLRFKYL